MKVTKKELREMIREEVFSESFPEMTGQVLTEQLSSGYTAHDGSINNAPASVDMLRHIRRRPDAPRNYSKGTWKQRTSVQDPRIATSDPECFNSDFPFMSPSGMIVPTRARQDPDAEIPKSAWVDYDESRHAGDENWTSALQGKCPIVVQHPSIRPFEYTVMGGRWYARGKTTHGAWSLVTSSETKCMLDDLFFNTQGIEGTGGCSSEQVQASLASAAAAGGASAAAITGGENPEGEVPEAEAEAQAVRCGTYAPDPNSPDDVIDSRDIPEGRQEQLTQILGGIISYAPFTWRSGRGMDALYFSIGWQQVVEIAYFVKALTGGIQNPPSELIGNEYFLSPPGNTMFCAAKPSQFREIINDVTLQSPVHVQGQARGSLRRFGSGDNSYPTTVIGALQAYANMGRWVQREFGTDFNSAMGSEDIRTNDNRFPQTVRGEHNDPDDDLNVIVPAGSQGTWTPQRAAYAERIITLIQGYMGEDEERGVFRDLISAPTPQVARFWSRTPTSGQQAQDFFAQAPNYPGPS